MRNRMMVAVVGVALLADTHVRPHEAVAASAVSTTCGCSIARIKKRRDRVPCETCVYMVGRRYTHAPEYFKRQNLNPCAYCRVV